MSARSRHHSYSLPRPRPTARSPPPSSRTPGSPFELDDEEDMPPLPSSLPPTPSSSTGSPFDSNFAKMQARASMMGDPRMSEYMEEMEAGPSTHQLGLPSPKISSSATLESFQTALEGHNEDAPVSTSLEFLEPTLPQRRGRGRRPASVYPHASSDVYIPHRNYTDPTPEARDFLEFDESPDSEHRLDVDLDAYSTELDAEEVAALEEREPTLSFVTTSTVESTTGTPSIGVQYGFSTDRSDGKPEAEPRIRLRTTAGRSNAYSSAESSMASGAYSFHGYSDNPYHPDPPPLPAMPNVFAANPNPEQVGLGISAHDVSLPRPHESQADSPSSNVPVSPTSSFRHRPWHRDVHNRLRSASGSSSITSISTSTDDEPAEASGSRASTSSHALAYPYNEYAVSDRLPWEDSPVLQTESKAVAMVTEGRDLTLDREKLETMGGIDALTEESLGLLFGVTHLLLPSFGSSLLAILPSLLVILAPTLVVLDMSNNDLSFLPESLRNCSSLEEINVSGNPLRQLPAWIGELTSLRMLAVDDCGLLNLPVEVSHLSSLHTICARRNRLVALPSWLCLLGQLETLRVDDNPFAAEWVPVVAPIVAGPSRLVRPAIPRRSSSQSSHRRRRSQTQSRSGVSTTSLISSRTVSSITSGPSDQPWMSPASSASQSAYQLPSPLNPIAEDLPHSAPPPVSANRLANSPLAGEPIKVPVSNTPSFSRGLRKMRSAGALLGDRSRTPSQTRATPTASSIFSLGAMSLASGVDPSMGEILVPPVRVGSLVTGGSARSASAAGFYPDEDEPAQSPQPNSSTSTSGTTKPGKWGFLRKMSMSRLKTDKDRSASLSTSANANLKSMPPLPHLHSDPVPSVARPGFTGARSAMTLPTQRVFAPTPPSDVSEFGQTAPQTPTSAATMPNASATSLGLPPVFATFGNTGGKTTVRGKRRSFLPIDPTPPSINVSIPSISPFMANSSMFDGTAPSSATASPAELAIEQLAGEAARPSSASMQPGGESVVDSPVEMEDIEARHASGLESIKSYLRDLHDLSRAPIEPYGGFEIVGSTDAGSLAASSAPSEHPGSPQSVHRNSVSEARRARRPTLEAQMSRNASTTSVAPSLPSEKGSVGVSVDVEAAGALTGKKFKNDRSKRARVIREIYETERTYVRGLGELVSIYVRPASQPVKPGQAETVVPLAERKIVFGGVESILTIHRDNLLPALEKAVRPLLEGTDDEEGQLSAQTAHDVGEVFRTYIAYMKQYSTYINNFDNALSRMKTWTAAYSGPLVSTPATPFSPKPPSPSVGTVLGGAILSAGLISNPSLAMSEAVTQSSGLMTSSQKKRVKAFLKRCREHPRHSQINLESYLLLPIQRVPRYKLLLEDLAMCTALKVDGPKDTLDDALNEISSLASLMNEEKRDADSRLRLFHWQQRISSRGPSPLVQPHRKLILDGPLNLVRLIKKASAFVEVETTDPIVDALGDGDATLMPSRSNKIVVPVEYIAPEPMDKQMMLILCTDLMVLVQKRNGPGSGTGTGSGAGNDGWDGTVDLFNVLRMATLREPASVINGNVLRVVDNKSIYYFSGESHESVLQWSRAINSARRR